MNKFKKHSSIYIYIYRILFIICPFLFALPTISCSNSNNSSNNIVNNGNNSKKFRVIKNQSLTSAQVANYIGDFKIATITINEGEASLLLDSSNQNEVPKKYKKNDQIRLVSSKNQKFSLFNNSTKNMWEIYGDAIQSLICTSNYVTYTVSVDDVIPWYKGILLNINGAQLIGEYLENKQIIPKLCQWDWKYEGSSTWNGDSWSSILNIDVISGQLSDKYSTFNPGNSTTINVYKNTPYYPYSNTSKTNYSYSNTLKTNTSATIMVAVKPN